MGLTPRCEQNKTEEPNCNGALLRLLLSYLSHHVPLHPTDLFHLLSTWTLGAPARSARGSASYYHHSPRVSLRPLLPVTIYT